MKTLRERLRKQLLSSKEYRHAYADEMLNLKIASLIRVLREQNDLRQGELAERIGTTQPGVSRLESANYAGWTVATLKKLAEAFDLRLDIDFKDFGSLWRDVSAINKESLRRTSFADDPEFKDLPQLEDYVASVPGAESTTTDRLPPKVVDLVTYREEREASSSETTVGFDVQQAATNGGAN